MTGFFIHSAAAPYIRAAALIVTLAAGFYLSRQGEALKTADAQHGMVSLQFAWTAERADMIVRSWGAVKDTAVNQVLIDYAFIAGYAVLLLGLGLAAERAAASAGFARLASLAHLAAFGALATGILDCLENVGLLAMLNGHISGMISAATSACSLLKFTLGTIALAVPIVAFVAI